MSEMIERVARALWADRYPDDEWTAEDERDYLGHARAAIEAMREPTKDMQRAGMLAMGADCDCDQVDCWHEMIDAAAAPPQP